MKKLTSLLLALTLFAAPLNAQTITGGGGSGGGGGSTTISSPIGQTTMAASVATTIASDQSNLPTNLKQVNGSTLSLGQTTSSASVPVTLASPNMVASALFTRPGDTTPYTAGDVVANSTTAGSVTPLSFAVAPANGVPVYLLKAKMITQTSGGAGVAISNGTFRLHIFSSAPTTSAGDNAAFSTAVTMANWCGTMDGTLISQGSDYSVGEFVPSFGAFVSCQPAGGSSTLYGLLEARAAFTPTNAETFTVSVTGQ